MKFMLMVEWLSKLITTVESWGEWVKPTMIAMSIVLLLGVIAQIVVAIVKGK